MLIIEEMMAWLNRLRPIMRIGDNLILIMAALVCWLGVLSAQAQGMVLDEETFWAQLEQTNLILQQTTEQPLDQRSRVLQAQRTMWESVTSVRLSDEETLVIDVRWLVEGLASTDVDELDALQARVQAMLDFHRREANVVYDPAAELDELNHVLQDPRFAYPVATPTAPPVVPTQPDNSDLLDPVLPTPDLSQLILIAVGIIVVLAVLSYLLRGLQVQGAEVATSPQNGGDPTTASSAVEMATDSRAAQDYRSAIRYLYLSTLLALDERGLLHYDPTLTNREHLQQIANQPQIVEILRPVVNIFERVWYGFAPADENLYQEFEQYIHRLRRIVP